MKTLYPMDMEEFMAALGENALVEQIKKSFQTDTSLPSALHDAAMRLYRQYLIVGGMPECVTQFAETRDYILVRHTQDTILASYLNDMSKYNNLNEIKKTRQGERSFLNNFSESEMKLIQAVCEAIYLYQLTTPLLSNDLRI